MTILGVDYYHIPRTCEKCGGVMIFKGVGEYECEKCGAIAYDDYGKVRLYIEGHRGANMSEIEAATGVHQRAIRQMLKESRLEVMENSKMFLQCESCGRAIRSGRFCPECEAKYHRSLEEEQRANMRSTTKGYSTEHNINEKGERRFMRRDI